MEVEGATVREWRVPTRSLLWQILFCAIGALGIGALGWSLVPADVPSNMLRQTGVSAGPLILVNVWGSSRSPFWRIVFIALGTTVSLAALRFIPQDPPGFARNGTLLLAGFIGLGIPAGIYLWRHPSFLRLTPEGLETECGCFANKEIAEVELESVRGRPFVGVRLVPGARRSRETRWNRFYIGYDLAFGTQYGIDPDEVAALLRQRLPRSVAPSAPLGEG